MFLVKAKTLLTTRLIRTNEMANDVIAMPFAAT
jgi:hypothetical protein